MSNTLAQMTSEEFEMLLSDILERKLLELLVDPDKGLILQAGLQEQLIEKQRITAQGERGQAFADVVTQLGL